MKQIYAPQPLSDLEPELNSTDPDPWDLEPYAHVAAREENGITDEDFCLLLQKRGI
jgi:hypothetical protein